MGMIILNVIIEGYFRSHEVFYRTQSLRQQLEAHLYRNGITRNVSYIANGLVFNSYDVTAESLELEHEDEILIVARR